MKSSNCNSNNSSDGSDGSNVERSGDSGDNGDMVENEYSSCVDKNDILGNDMDIANGSNWFLFN